MTAPEDDFEVTAEQEPFVMVPVWLFGTSSNAVKLYAILKRYANNRTNQAWPSRDTLASAMGFKQAKTLDPIIKELEQAGAVRVTRSARGTRRAVNVYHLAVAGPLKVVAPKNGPLPADPDLVGRCSDISRPVQRQLVDPENGHELEPRTITKGTRKDSAAVAAPDAPITPPAIFETEAAETRTAQTLLAEWIDNCNPAPLSKVRGQMAREIKNLLTEGVDYDAVRDGLIALHQRGQHPATLPSFVHNIQQQPTTAMQPSGRHAGAQGMATGTQRAMQALAAGQQLQAQYDQQNQQNALGGTPNGFTTDRPALGPGSADRQSEDGRGNDSGVVGNPQPYRFR